MSFLGDFATKIKPVSTWADLTLPEPHLQALQEIAAHLGSGEQLSTGGATALFSGENVPGKMIAAEALAQQFGKELYRVDLSQIVSEYVDETEKNLQRLFDAAEERGAILLFDEADALFGKQSEVKDGHDRYANIKINYLLQHMEQYSGVAILAANTTCEWDPALLQRIRFLVDFPSTPVK